MPLIYRDLADRVLQSKAVKDFNANFEEHGFNNVEGAEKIAGLAPIQIHIKKWNFLEEDDFNKANAHVVVIEKTLDNTKKPETDLVKKAEALGIGKDIIENYQQAFYANQAAKGQGKRTAIGESTLPLAQEVTQLKQAVKGLTSTGETFTKAKEALTQAIAEKEAIKNITLDLASSPDTAAKLIPRARNLLFGLQDLDALNYLDISHENLNKLMVSSDSNKLDGGEIALALKYNYQLLADINKRTKEYNTTDTKGVHAQESAALAGTKEVVEGQIKTLIKQQVMLGGILMERVLVNETLQNKKTSTANDPKTQRAFDKIEKARSSLTGVDINQRTEFYAKTDNARAIDALNIHKKLNAGDKDYFSGRETKDYFNQIMLPDFQQNSKLARDAERTRTGTLKEAEWNDEATLLINSIRESTIPQAGISGCIDYINQARKFLEHTKDKKIQEGLGKIITEAYTTIKMSFINDKYQLGNITSEQYASLKEIVETMEAGDKVKGKDTQAYKDFIKNTNIADKILEYKPGTKEGNDAFFESLYSTATDEQREALFALKDIIDGHPSIEKEGKYKDLKAVSGLVTQLSSLFPEATINKHEKKNRGTALLEAAVVKFVNPTVYNGETYKQIKKYITEGRGKANKSKLSTLGVKKQNYEDAKKEIYPPGVNYDISKVTPQTITEQIFLEAAKNGDFVRLLQHESKDYSTIGEIYKNSELANALQKNSYALRSELTKYPSLVNYIAGASPQLSEQFAMQLAGQILRYGLDKNSDLAARQIAALKGFIDNKSIPLETRTAFKNKIAERVLIEEANGIKPSSPIDLYRILGSPELNDKIIQYENRMKASAALIKSKVEPVTNEINKGSAIDFNKIANYYSEIITEIKGRANLRQARIEMQKQIFQDCMNNPDKIDSYMIKINVLENLDDNGADFILQLSLVKFYKEIEELRVDPDNTRTINSIKDIVNVPKVNDMKIMLTSLSPEQKFKSCADLAGVLVVSKPEHSNYARLKVLYNLMKMSLEGTEYQTKLENSDFSSLGINDLDTDSLTLLPDEIIEETAKLVKEDTPKTTTKRTVRRDDNAPLNRFEKVSIKFKAYQSKFDSKHQTLINKLVRKMSEAESVSSRISGTQIIQPPKVFTKPNQVNGEISSEDIVSALGLDPQTDASLIEDIQDIGNDEILGDIVSTARVIAANKIAEENPTEDNLTQLNKIILDESQNRKGTMLESDFETASNAALVFLEDHNQIYSIIQNNFSGYATANIGSEYLEVINQLSSYIIVNNLKQNIEPDFKQTDGKISTIKINNNPVLSLKLNAIGKTDPLLLGKIVSMSIVRAAMIHYGTGELTHDNITKVDTILDNESKNRKPQKNWVGYTADVSTFQDKAKISQSELKQIPSEYISQTPAGAEVASNSPRTSDASNNGMKI